ncbi:MAG: thiosulfate oxidation carrier complex protein SoxZ [Acidobacteria bacterium]|nr:thiosulfate oxidation carrier complex protein SoxZ [Acidobacteriota bacterium]
MPRTVFTHYLPLIPAWLAFGLGSPLGGNEPKLWIDPQAQVAFFQALSSQARRPANPSQLGEDERRHTPTIEAPAIVENGQMVMVTVAVDHPMEVAHHIRRIILYDPHSLMKLKYVADLAPDGGRPYLSASLRLAKSTQLEALAECNLHGLWLGQSRYIRVGVSGCSVLTGPPVRGVAEPVLRVHSGGKTSQGEAGPIQLRLRHPMESGMAMDDQDRIQRKYEPFFVQRLEIRADGRKVASFSMGPGLSHNPILGFRLRSGLGKTLELQATNTEGQRFETRIALGAFLEGW